MLGALTEVPDNPFLGGRPKKSPKTPTEPTDGAAGSALVLGVPNVTVPDDDALPKMISG